MANHIVFESILANSCYIVVEVHPSRRGHLQLWLRQGQIRNDPHLDIEPTIAIVFNQVQAVLQLLPLLVQVQTRH